MTCITEKLENTPCLVCKRADQVYIGHGIVRFCAHCTISWDPSEDGTLLSKSVIFSDSATDGELPEDIVSRMGVLSGNVLSSLDFEARLRNVLALPEDLFLKHNRSGDHPISATKKKKHLGTKKRNNNEGTFQTPQALQDSIPESGIAGGYRPPSERVWQGERYAEPDQRLSLLQTGEIGEQVAMHAFSEKYSTPFVPLNVGGVTNEPIDVKGDSIGMEVKGAMGYNGNSSRAWRAREGQRGKTEKAYIKSLSDEGARKYTDAKRASIIARKTDMLAELSEDHRRTFAGKMGGVILSPDGRHADVFEVNGFHRYVGWASGAVEANYIGTYSLGDDIFQAAMNKYLKGIIIAKAVADSGYTLEALMYSGPMIEDDAWRITPEMHELLSWPHIWLSVSELEGDYVYTYLGALLDADIDPETVSEVELNTIWNHTFSQEPIEVDMTYLTIQKMAAVEFLKHNRPGDHPIKTYGSSINKMDIVERRPMGDGRKNPELVVFEDGSEGVFKKWDDDSVGEILAYELSEELGFGSVPPTARYERGGEVGTVQKFSDSEGNGLSVKHDKRNLSGQEMATMDYITGNSDRRDPNFLVKKDGSFVAIDNGASFSAGLIEPHNESTGFVGANAGRKIDPDILRNVRMADADLIVNRMEKADVLADNVFMQAMAKVAKASGFNTPAEYLGSNLRKRIDDITDFGGVPPFVED